MSIKTGGCPEDCGYCPQSVHFDTRLEAGACAARLGPARFGQACSAPAGFGRSGPGRVRGLARGPPARRCLGRGGCLGRGRSFGGLGRGPGSAGLRSLGRRHRR
jgi:hypothetical protein